LLLKMYPLLSQ
jgi:hypothetical protein